jgi:hypothetical protein
MELVAYRSDADAHVSLGCWVARAEECSSNAVQGISFSIQGMTSITRVQDRTPCRGIKHAVVSTFLHRMGNQTGPRELAMQLTRVRWLLSGCSHLYLVLAPAPACCRHSTGLYHSPFLPHVGFT